MAQSHREASLCARCRNIFNITLAPEDPRQYVVRDWQPSIEHLLDSSNRGCYLCAMVWSDLQQVWPEYRELDTGKLSTYFHLQRLNKRIGVDYSQLDSSHRFVVEFFLHNKNATHRRYSISTNWLRDDDLSDDSFDDRSDFEEADVGFPRQSTADLTNAALWLNHCLEKHESCGPQGSPSVPLASRLIHVRKEEGQLKAKLLERHSFLEGCQYLTLSHCWGSGPIYSLRTDRLAQLKIDIPILQLPKTFQDAFDVTLRLGYEYLWIDSLCILQDVTLDWAAEAKKMADIYEYAVCNIAAIAFTSSETGLFVPKPINIERPLTVSVKIRSAESPDYEKKFSFIETHYWGNRVDFAPLSGRAWFHQERFFAPRILHFGKDQLLWECKELTACEMAPSGLPPSVWTSQSTGYLSYKDVVSSYQAGDLGRVRWMWLRIVQSYSRAALTYPNDKLIAMSGIVKRFEKLLDNTPVAGLWAEYLARDLLWYPEASSSSGNKRAPERAPTWSWACVDQNVFYTGPPNKDEIVAIVETEQVSNSVSQGTGELRIRAPLVLANCRPAETDGGQHVMGAVMLRTHTVQLPLLFDWCPGDLEGITGSVVSENEDGDITTDLVPVYLLVIAIKTSVSGLILRRCERAGFFSRIGYFETPKNFSDAVAPVDPGVEIEDLDTVLGDSLPISPDDYQESHGEGVYTITII